MEAVRCGQYEIVAQRENSLLVREDGTVELIAEHPYLVRLEEGADPGALRGAMSVPHGGTEGVLRFGNFIGRTELGGRRMEVHSLRLDGGAAAEMLDEVSTWFAGLPFGVDSPVAAGHATRRDPSPRVLYHAFALLRDAYRGIGPHDLREAIERILARPFETLLADEPRLVPTGAASRIDPATLAAIPRAPELLRRVAKESPMAKAPATRQLRGMLPEMVRVRPFRHSTDNPENRFVAGSLDEMVDLLRRFERHARIAGGPARIVNATEAAEIADYLRRCRRHRVLEPVRGVTKVPTQSAVLRSRPGYRDLLGLHGELEARSRATEAHDAERLLESRDAAEIYEYWCYVMVAQKLERMLGPPVSRDRFATGAFSAEMRWGYRVTWPEVSAFYNLSFARPTSSGHKPGFDSYSLRLRPDIVLRSPDGRLNLLDAKLKRRFLAAVEKEVDTDLGGTTDTFKPEDLHKMHAYRDALSADGVWVLYPGSKAEPDKFAAPGQDGRDGLRRFKGVGAIALRPGADHDGGLTTVLAGSI